jgi:ESS family glutamate:Na+ symporter
VLKLNFVHTLAFSGIVLFVGYWLRRLIPPLARYNIPAPVIGGLLIAIATLVARNSGVTLFEFDITLRDPLMIAFFTSIGFGASFSLLKVGGPMVVKFFLASTVFAILQNVLGILLTLPFKLHPLFGVLAGSVTLTGGPATGLAFAPLFEKAGVLGAATIAIAAPMFGITSGGLIGGPVATFLIDRHKLKKPRHSVRPIEFETAAEIVEQRLPEPQTAGPADEDEESFVLLKNFVVLLVAMWGGFWLSQFFISLGFTLPAYIGAMFVAAFIRNIDDLTHIVGLSQRTIDDIGNVALSLFLAMALMTLKLWDLAGLVVPLLIILIAQVVLVTVVCFWPLFQLMGRDYESAVISGGFIGFMLGTMANSMAVMKSLVERYGKAPRAFLAVPMVGAFLVDFTNAMIITVFLNIFK